MSIIIDPTLPANSENVGGGLGASRIRAIASWLQEMFGGAGSGAVTYNIAPFNTDTSTGLSTVPGVPTATLGIATKGYVDAATPSYTNASGGDAYVIANPIPFTAIDNGTIQFTIFNTTNTTTTPTLNVDGLGAFPIVADTGGASTIAIGALKSGETHQLIFNGGVNSWVVAAPVLLQGDFGGSYNAPKVVGFNGQPLAATAGTASQIYVYNGGTALWTPTTVPGAAARVTKVTSLSSATIGNGAVATIFSAAVTAPATLGTGTGWVPFIRYSVFFSSHTSATCYLTCSLADTASLISAAGSGASALNVGNAHTVAISGSYIGAIATPSQATTILLTGYAEGAQVDLSTGSDTGSGATSALSISWLSASV